MIIKTYGNICDSTAQVIVNPVNLVGVMGKGLALEFKQKYPEMYKEYRCLCLNGQLKDMGLHLYKKSTPWILNFLTKFHWRNPSDLELIEQGLIVLAKNYQEWGIHSIIFPKIGCGLGGLDWNRQVKPLIEKYMGLCNDLECIICE